MTFEEAMALIAPVTLVVIGLLLWVERRGRAKPLKRDFGSAKHLPPGER